MERRIVSANLVLATLASFTSAQVVTRASVSTAGAEANYHTPMPARATCLAVSADGRFVAFLSSASNLVAGDTNGVDDAFVRDLTLGTTERVSVSTSGQQALADRYGRGCFDVAISGDGRYVTFSTAGTKLIDGEKGGGSRGDVYLRDRVAGTTARVSVSASGSAPNGDSWYASITPDGRYLAFYSHASNLVANDRNRTTDFFVRDLWTRTNVRASVDSAGREANSSSLVTTNSAISADGRYVVFLSAASNLVAGDGNSVSDAFVRDLSAGSTERVSLSVWGAELASPVLSASASISGNGRFVTYVYSSTDPSELPPDVPVGRYHAYQFDRAAQTTACVSRGPGGEPASEGIGTGMLGSSADGRYLAFTSRSTNLVPGFPGNVVGVFVRDGVTGQVFLASPGLGGGWPDGSAFPWQVVLDAAGGTVVFGSEATNLVTGDANAMRDVFVAR